MIKRAILVGLIVFAYAANCDGTLMTLNRATAARPLAMGNAYVGLADDGAALFINPAGLAQIKQTQLTSLYANLDAGYSYASLGGAWPGRTGEAFGLGYKNFTISGIQILSDTVDLTEQEILLTIAKQAPGGWSVGGDLRVISQQVSRNIAGFSAANAQGGMVDLALKYTAEPGLAVGASLQNAFGKISYANGTSDQLPANLILGLSAKLPVEREARINFDLSKQSGEPVLAHCGTEWWLQPTFALRAGLELTPKSSTDYYLNLTAGLGLKISGVTMDYALYKSGDPAGSLTHYFSLGYVGREPMSKSSFEANVYQLKHFSDVPEGYWARRSIEYVTALGLMNSYPDGTFRPEQPISRTETVTLLVRAKNYPKPAEPQQVFPDVPLDFWAAEPIQMAYENKLTIGYPDGDFKPRNNTTKSQGIIFLTRYENYRIPDPAGRLGQSLTRAEWAEMIYRTRSTQQKIKASTFVL